MLLSHRGVLPQSRVSSVRLIVYASAYLSFSASSLVGAVSLLGTSIRAVGAVRISD